jgi:hypothetical protein
VSDEHLRATVPSQSRFVSRYMGFAETGCSSSGSIQKHSQNLGSNEFADGIIEGLINLASYFRFSCLESLGSRGFVTSCVAARPPPAMPDKGLSCL